MTEELELQIERLQKENERLKSELHREREIGHQTAIRTSLSSLLKDYKTVFDELPPDVRNQTLTRLVEGMLEEKNAKIDRDDAGNLILVGKNGTSVVGEDHRSWDLQTLVQKTLEANKVIRTHQIEAVEKHLKTPTQLNTQKQQSVQTPREPLAVHGERPTVMSHLINSSLKDLEDAQAHGSFYDRSNSSDT